MKVYDLSLGITEVIGSGNIWTTLALRSLFTFLILKLRYLSISYVRIPPRGIRKRKLLSPLLDLDAVFAWISISVVGPNYIGTEHLQSTARVLMSSFTLPAFKMLLKRTRQFKSFLKTKDRGKTHFQRPVPSSFISCPLICIIPRIKRKLCRAMYFVKLFFPTHKHF